MSISTSIHRFVSAVFLSGMTLQASLAQAHPTTTTTRGDLLKTVDLDIVARGHHLDLQNLAHRDFGVILSINDVAPSSPHDGDLLTVTYTVTNFSPMPAKGITTGALGRLTMANADGTKPASIDLAPGKSMTAVLRTIGPLNLGTSTLALSYRDDVVCSTKPGKFGRPTTVCLAGVIANDSMAVTVTRDPAKIDDDKDGIPDLIEQALLERFRPYFRFSLDGHQEIYAPTDVDTYLRRSELLISGCETKQWLICDNYGVAIDNSALASDPSAVLTATGSPGSPRFDNAPAPSNYHVNPLASIAGLAQSDPGRHGNDWAEVLARKNVGLYGHVVPVNLTDPFGFSFVPDTHDPYEQCPNGLTKLSPGPSKTYYKIEYWQFFGYNEAEKAYIGNHEGDWTSVQIIYDPTVDAIRSVMHFAHGLMFRFDLTPENFARTVTLGSPDGNMLEIRGCNYFKFGGGIDLSHLDLGSVPPKMVINSDQLAHAQNNVVRLLQDPTSGRYEHPVVYIENGTHEFFPTEAWSFYGAPNHNGDGYHYLASTPPNLGEVENPLGDFAFANVVLLYNGYWGAFSRFNDPPHGPTLHRNWTPLAGSPSAGSLGKLTLGF